jgi:hypothetical protein
MIAHAFEYTAPASLAEAPGLIADGGKPLSGGMSLIPMMKLRLAAPEHLVDLMQDTVLPAKAIPGCEALERIGEDEYSLKMKMVLASLCALAQLCSARLCHIFGGG